MHFSTFMITDIIHTDDTITEEKKHFDAEFSKITDDLKEVEEKLVEGVEEWQRQTNVSSTLERINACAYIFNAHV